MRNEVKQPINTHGISIDLDFLTNGDDDFGLMGFEDFDFSMEFPLPVWGGVDGGDDWH